MKEKGEEERKFDFYPGLRPHVPHTHLVPHVALFPAGGGFGAAAGGAGGFGQQQQQQQQQQGFGGACVPRGSLTTWSFCDPVDHVIVLHLVRSDHVVY